MAIVPPPEVVSAFGGRGDAVPLAGGEGLSFRVGPVVLKRVHDVGEADWVQAMLAAVEQDQVRVPSPIAAATGRWVHEGWSASEFIADLTPAAPDWDLIIEAGLALGLEGERARPRDREPLAARTHRWAVADRVAFGECDVPLSPEAASLRDRLAALVGTGSPPERHFVHGDLAGNVFLDAEGRPTVLDVSPYLRPRRWAAAIVVADAVLWHGADVALSRRFAADAGNRTLLARALIYRLVAEQLAVAPRHGARLGPYRRIIAALD